MKVTEDHWLEGAVRDIIAGGAPMPVRRCLVEHFTSGATAKSSIESMRSQGLSAHLVIDRDGTIYQCRPFNLQCSHAGKSRWKDPNTGTLYNGLNSCAIGIEIANAGNDPAVIKWAVDHAGSHTIEARHRNGGPLEKWEAYSDAQIKSVREASKALVERYHLDDLSGHDCIAPERKNDPGPAFPMQEIREYCGFHGLPAVHYP